MEDFSSTVEHLELPRQHVHFDRNRKRAKPCIKGRESLIWFCSHFQFQERVLFAPFWSSKCSNRPCSGFLALQESLKCHSIAVKTTTMAVVHLPKSLENRSTTTPLVGIPGRPCLRLTSRNVFFVTQRKNEKLLKLRGTYPLYLGVFPNDSAQRCSNINDARILMRKDDVRSWRSSSWQTFMRRKWCTMPLPTESTPAPSPWTPLPSFNDWAQWQLPDMAFKCLTLMVEEVDHRCLLYYESIKPHCAICMASYCEMK